MTAYRFILWAPLYVHSGGDDVVARETLMMRQLTKSRPTGITLKLNHRRRSAST